jgi:hypothetical protein
MKFYFQYPQVYYSLAMMLLSRLPLEDRMAAKAFLKTLAKLELLKDEN